MRKSYARILIGFVILLAVLFITLPYVFMGPPGPLFSISNNDVNKHSVAVELINSDNKSMFKQTYELAPKTQISQSKPLWLLLLLSIPPGNTNECTFKVTLDNNVVDTYQIGLQAWVMADIILYGSDAETPLSVRILAV